MDRLFLDANILFTAAYNPDGKAAFLFEAANQKYWVLLSSAYAMGEARRNIKAKCSDRSSRLESLIGKLLEVRQPTLDAMEVALPAKDKPIYLAALASGATHLLTGDLHDFGPLMNRPRHTGGLIIQTVAEYLGG